MNRPAERERWAGLCDVLFSIQRHYTAERALEVAETAVKMHGRYGFFDGYPVHQFMRDLIPIGWWEGDGSGNILFWLTQLLLQRDGRDFANLLAEMARGGPFPRCAAAGGASGPPTRGRLISRREAGRARASARNGRGRRQSASGCLR